jgi:RHS repeat-associated protein
MARTIVNAILLLLFCLRLSVMRAIGETADKSGVKPSVLSLPSGPGSIEGLGKSFQPQINTGTATYGIPMKLPPGTAGFAPGVELSYNSGSGNSAFGQSWNCTPALCIERQTDKGFPRYRDTDNPSMLRDVFLFHGEELVPLTDGTFRCKNETEFRRFTPIFSQGAGVDSWLVEDRDGTKHWLGRYLGNAPNGGDSRVANPLPPQDGLGFRTPSEQTFLWCEDAAQDVNGNRIEFDYATDGSSPGELYIDQIRYFAASNSANYHLIKFYYQTRSDQFSDNRPGFPRVTAMRCREIGIGSFYDGQIHPVRSYVLSYSPADGALGDLDSGLPLLQKRVNLGLSYLHALTEYDSSRGLGGLGPTGNPFPPMRFTYSGFYMQTPPTNVLQELTPLAYRLRPEESNPLVAGPVQGMLVQSSNPDGNGTTSLIFDALLENAEVQFADMNGDGLPDILNTKTDQDNPLYRVAYNYGNGIFRTSISVSNSPSSISLADNTGANTVTLTDMNGDGIIDLVQIVANANGPVTRIYTNLYDPAKSGGPTGFASSPSPDAATPLDLLLSAPNVRQIDLNFDKRPDVLVCNEQGMLGYRSELGGGWTDLGTLNWSQAPGDGLIPDTYSFSRIDSPLAERSNPLVFLSDMNGDRLLDLVQIVISADGQAVVNYRPMIGTRQWGSELTFQFATTNGAPSGTAAILPMPGLLADPVNPQNNWGSIQLMDVNGDGLTDVVYVQQNQSISVFFNCAGKALLGPYQLVGTPSYTPYDTSYPTILRTLDINGNGSTDLVFYQPNGGKDGVSLRYLDFISGQKPGLLQVIDNGIGRRTFIRYRASTDDLIRARVSGHPWLTTTPNPLWVVSGMVDDIGLDLNGDGQPDEYATSFDYRDAYYDGFEHQFRGFAYAQKISWGDDVDSSTGLPTGNGLGQVGAPTGVTRYRFMTGSPDNADNDQYTPGYDTEPRPVAATVDETTPLGGREEESLKGKPVWEEAVDGSALVDPKADFDVCASATGQAALSGSPYGPAASMCTPDTYVYSRTHSQWALRRLYRPSGVVAPKGRLLLDEPSTVSEVPGKSVTFPVLLGTVTETIEANALLQSKFSHPNAPVATQGPVVTSKELDYDNFGNTIWDEDDGIVSGLTPLPENNRVKTNAFILTRGGSGSIANWIINRVQSVRVQDTNGVFVSETRHYYDGLDFVGLPLGQIGFRGLETRTEERVKDSSYAAPAIDQVPTSQSVLEQLKVPSDPRTSTPEWTSSIRKAYDPYGNVISTMDPLGQVAGGVADFSAGHARRLVYDLIFHTFPIEEHIYVGGGQTDLVMYAQYQRAATTTGPEVPWGFGVMTRSIDFNGNSTDYFYDSFARLTAIVKPGDSELLPTDLFTYRPADPQRGLIYNYDRNGNLTSGTGPVNGIASSVETDASEVSGQFGVFTTLTYTDANDNKLLSMEEDETADQFDVKEATSYSLRGTPVYKFQPYRQTGSGFSLPSFSLPRTDLFADAMGRVIRTLDPPETAANPSDRRETRTHYLPFVDYDFNEENIASSDPSQPHLNTPMVNYKDGLGRLIGVDETVRNAGDGSGVGTLQTWHTTYDYDLNDKLVHIRDSQNNEKWFRYDGLGRKIFMNDPDRGTMTYTYDDASNLRSTVDAKAHTISYDYDGVNRLISEFYGLTNRTPDVTYHYDTPAGSIDIGDGTAATPRNTLGMLAYVQDLSGEEHTSYDARGRVNFVLKRIPDPLNGVLVSYRTGFSYDSLERVNTLTYPDNDFVSYGYNSRGLVNQITGGASGFIISSIRYQPSAQLQEIGYGNGVLTTYGYDPRLRLNSLITTPRTNAASPLIAFSYDFDGVSNIRDITDNRPASVASAGNPRRNTQTFSYDDLYRITSAQYSFAVPPGTSNDGLIDYRYDRIGNMVTQTSSLSDTDPLTGLPVANLGKMNSGGASGRSNRVGRMQNAAPGPHALSQIVSTNSQNRNYSYDPNGNMTVIDGLTNTWDFKDRLVAVEDSHMRAQYTYDYTDRRITKKIFTKTNGVASSSSILATLYIHKYFEVRDHDAPVKYVWNGNTRVARITGSLNNNQRVQRLRLWPGWNLISLAVDGASIPANSPVLEAYKWNQSTLTWLPIAKNESLAAASVLWLNASTSAMTSVTGTYTPPFPAAVPTGPSFQTAAGLEGLPFTNASLFNIVAWKFDGPSQAWFVRYGTNLPVQSEFGGAFAPGEAFMVRADASTTLAPPDSALGTRYYHQDHLGSSSYLGDASGQIIDETAFYPFGYPRWELHARGIRENYRFTHKETDSETSLNYFEARYLASTQSRFLSLDPLDLAKERLGEPQRLNTYSYCRNGPTKYNDLDGRDTYLYFYSSSQTGSGAGHVAIGIETHNQNRPAEQQFFEASPKTSKPSAPMMTTGTIGSMQDVLNKAHTINSAGEVQQPTLILRLKTEQGTDFQLRAKAVLFTIENKMWTFHSADCADLVKTTLRNTTQVNPGRSLISTPQELAHDIMKNNQQLFKSGELTVVKGDLKSFGEGSAALGTIKAFFGQGKEGDDHSPQSKQSE